MTDVVDAALREVGQMPLWAVLVTVCVVMALETTALVGVVVPGDIVVLFAAATALETPVEAVLLVGAVTLGSLIGETVGYGIGRRWGPRLRSSGLGQRLGEARLARAADHLHQRGGPAVFAARYLAALHALTPIVAGALGMRYRRFIAWCAAGGLTWASLYVCLGVLAGASYRQYAEGLGTAALVAVGGLVGAGAFVLVISLRRRGLPVGQAAREIGLVGVLVTVAVLATGAAHEAGSRAPDVAAYILVLAGALALLGRSRWPLPVLVATVVAFGAYHLSDYPAGPPVLAVVVAGYSAARAGHLSSALAAGGLITGSGLVYRLVVEGDDVFGTETAVWAALFVTTALLGDAMRSRGTTDSRLVWAAAPSEHTTASAPND